MVERKLFWQGDVIFLCIIRVGQYCVRVQLAKLQVQQLKFPAPWLTDTHRRRLNSICIISPKSRKHTSWGIIDFERVYTVFMATSTVFCEGQNKCENTCGLLPATTHEASSRQIATISEYTMPILVDEQQLRMLIRVFFRSSAGWQLWRASASLNSSPYFFSMLVPAAERSRHQRSCDDDRR